MKERLLALRPLSLADLIYAQALDRLAAAPPEDPQRPALEAEALAARLKLPLERAEEIAAEFARAGRVLTAEERLRDLERRVAALEERSGERARGGDPVLPGEAPGGRGPEDAGG